MNYDIKPILDSFPYEPGEVNARIIKGLDGKEKLQMRLDLGLIQMELEGRPDGQRPHGYESLLDYYEAKAEQEGRECLELNSEECEALRAEGTQYYYRYLCCLQLGEFRRAARDTARNLRLFDFMKKHAASEEDKLALERYRPYVLMMNTKAEALMLATEGRIRAALSRIDRGAKQIEEFYRAHGNEQLIILSVELMALNSLRKHLENAAIRAPAEVLEQKLQEAIEREDYALAARIRDQLRELQKKLQENRPAGEHEV